MANNDRPDVVYLIGLIEVWKPENKAEPMKRPESDSDILRITEFESIEIHSSYQNIIDTATVNFPRGTIIRKLISPEEADMKSVVVAGTDSNGVLEENRQVNGKAVSSVATVKNFEVDNRIQIRLGYTTDYRVFRMTKVGDGKKNIYNDPNTYNEYLKHLTLMFDGFISNCSVETPISISCENLGRLLKFVTCKKITTTDKTTIRQLLNPKDDNGGVYGLLSGSKIKLKPGFSKDEDMVIGKQEITPDLTVFDVLNQWHRWKAYSFIKLDGDGNPVLDIKRSYTTTVNLKGQERDSIMYGKTVNPTTVDFSYHVANNGLTLFKTDKRFLAVKASCLEADGKGYVTLTIVPNPEADVDESDGRVAFRVINEKKISKKAMKKHHVKMVSEGSSKVNLSEYTVIEYQSRNIGLTHDQLLDEAIKFYGTYNMNGLDGNLTLFGDLRLATGDIIRIHDPRSTQKDGEYLVEQVNTKFDTGGFRQTITLPYCIRRDADEKEKKSE